MELEITYKSLKKFEYLKSYVKVDLALFEDDFIYNKITARVKIIKDGVLLYCGLLKKFDDTILNNSKQLEIEVDKALKDLYIDELTKISVDTSEIPVFINV